MFPYSKNIKTSFNLGKLVPYQVEEMLPGDTLSIGQENLTRIISPFVKAPLENLKIHFDHFFVPNRLAYDG
jgi:hypothetical protein